MKKNFNRFLYYLGKTKTTIRTNKAKAITFIILVIFLISIPSLKGKYQDYNERQEAVTVEQVSITLYKSKGSRDDSKTEQYAFESGDNIQAVAKFEQAETDSSLNFELLDGEEVLQKVESINISGESGERYISLKDNLEEGDYTVQVLQEGYVLAEREFSIQ